MQAAFNAVDDWNYTYIDTVNLKRFMIKMNYVPTRFELVSIIRRVDTDGDAKLKLKEFSESVKSQFALVNQYGSKATKGKPTRPFAPNGSKPS